MAASSPVEPPAPSTTPTVTVQPAYRTTCDNCMRSKVRCSKDHPSCHRCLGQGVACGYSRSRRLKKVIEYRPDPTHQTESPSNGGTSTSDFTSATSEDQSRPSSMSNVDLFSPFDVPTSTNVETYQEPWDLFTNELDLSDSLVGMEGFDTITPQTPLNAALDTHLTKLPDWDTQQWSTTAERTMTDPFAPLTPPESSPGFTSSLCQSRTSTSTSIFDTTPTPTSKPGCAHIAASVLQSLESPGAPLIESASKPLSNERLRRNLDTVISTNKSAMEILHRISSCTCSVPKNHLVMISAVLFMVLAWYEACLGACDRACACASETSIASSLPSTNDSNANEETVEEVSPDCADLVHVPPIQVGSLCLGVETRRQVVKQIVLSELAKATAVIERLTEWSPTTSTTGKGAMCAEGGIEGCGGVDKTPKTGFGAVAGYQELEVQLQYSLQAALQKRIEEIAGAAAAKGKES